MIYENETTNLSLESTQVNEDADPNQPWSLKYRYTGYMNTTKYGKHNKHNKVRKHNTTNTSKYGKIFSSL